MAMPVAEVRAAFRADLKVVRFPDSVQLRLVGMGRQPNVRQIQTDSGWLIEVTTAQGLQALDGPKFLTLPDVGIESVSFDGKGSIWRLEVTTMPGRKLGAPVVSANGRDVQVSFQAQALPEMTAAGYDLTAPGRVARYLRSTYENAPWLHRW